MTSKPRLPPPRLPPRWKFGEKGLTGERAYHGGFTLWVLLIPASIGKVWAAGLSDAGGPSVRVFGHKTRAKAIEAAEAAAVAGGWLLPRVGVGGSSGKSRSTDRGDRKKRKETRRGKSDA